MVQAPLMRGFFLFVDTALLGLCLAVLIEVLGSSGTKGRNGARFVDGGL